MADAAARGGPVQLGIGTTVVFTAGGAGAVVQLIHVCNEAAVARTFSLSVGADGAGKRLYKDYPLLAGEVIHEALFLPLSAAETVQGLADAGSAVTVIVGAVNL